MPNSFASTSLLRFSQIDLRILGIALSTFCSLIVILSNPVLNNDAYIYLKAAEVFIGQGAAQAGEIYTWNTYPILIAALDKVLPGGGIAAAHCLNLLFTGLISYSFISLSMELFSSRSAAVFALLLIVCLASLNEMRYYIVRDFGFWGFALLSLVFAVRLINKPSLLNLFLSCSIMLVAALFRLEGIVLLLFLPCRFLFGQGRLTARLKYVALTYSVLALTLIVIITVCSVFGVEILSKIKTAYQFYWPQTVQIFSIFSSTANDLNDAIFHTDNFPGHNKTIAILSVLSAYLYALAAGLIQTLSLLFFLLSAFALFKRKLIPNKQAQLLIFFFSLSIFILLFFLAAVDFITPRYIMFPALLLLCLLSGFLDSLYSQACKKNKKKSFITYSAILVVFFLADSLISFGHSKDYIEEASLWTQNNVSADQRIQTNSRKIAYESGLVRDYHLIDPQEENYSRNLNQADFLIWRFTRRNSTQIIEMEENQNLILVQQFLNDRNDQVRIYRITE